MQIDNHSHYNPRHPYFQCAAAGHQVLDSSDYLSPPSVETLYVDHHPWLQGWLRRRLGNAADAADLAQDAFVRLLVSPRRFGSLPEARVYLRTMAGGLCVDLWRRRQIEQAWLDTVAALPQDQVPSAEHQAIVLQTLQQVDTLLRALPAKAALAFVMVAGCGVSTVEAAEELGVSDRMVRKYVAQAMLHCLKTL